MVFGLFYTPWTLNTGTCLWQGDLFLFCGPTEEPCVSHNQHRKNQERFWKNAGEWTGGVERSKEEIPGSKHSMYGYILTYSRF